MYKVSVIIPVYNGEKYLADTINHILKCTISDDIQLVVVNDGSRDNSEKICQELLACNPNIKYVYKENGGIVSARNKGLELAEGKYICFCDQDDIVENNMYELLYNEAERQGAEFGFCSTGKYIDGKIEPFEVHADRVYVESDIRDKIINPIAFNGTKLGNDNGERWICSIWKCIYNRQFLLDNNIKFRKFVNYEDDYLFFFDVASRAHKSFSMNFIGYYWRINNQSETYNWKYIDEFDAKYMLFLEDVLAMMKRIGFSEEDIRNYQMIELCTMMKRLIYFEGSKFNHKSYAQRIANIKRVAKEHNYKEFLGYSKHIILSPRNKPVYFFMSKDMWNLAYIYNNFYEKIRIRLIKYKFWTGISNWIYRKSKE
ncbi:MAG: glycosyltransferase [Clostridia bacterium]|nr:glycosyltransferase [Clostridia bacterium]